MQDEQLYGQDTQSHRQALRHPPPRCTVDTGSQARLEVVERRVDV